jgi:hypothetical protein
MIFFTVALILDGLMVWGFLRSSTQRGIDRRYFAAFVGFGAAVAAVTCTIIGAVETAIRGHASPWTMGPALQAFTAVISVITFSSLLVALFAGLFSRGIQRIALIGCCLVVTLMMLGIAAAHFGD